MAPEQINALQFLTQALGDFANTLPPSAREPFIEKANQHVLVLRESMIPAEG